jgi:hypothetical protein
MNLMKGKAFPVFDQAHTGVDVFQALAVYGLPSNALGTLFAISFSPLEEAAKGGLIARTSSEFKRSSR